MIKVFKKQWLFSIILGVVLLTCGIIMLATKKPSVTINKNWTINFLQIVSGLLIVALSVYFIYPSTQKYTGGFRVLFLIELVFVLMVGVVGFLLPGFGLRFGDSFFASRQLTFWSGLIFVIHGLVEFYICSYATKRQHIARFLVASVLVIGGSYLLFAGSNIESNISKVIQWAFVIVGVLVLVLGILGVTSKSKKK